MNAVFRFGHRLSLITVIAPLISGCWINEGRGTGSFGASLIAREPSLLVATNRRPIDSAARRPWFSAARGENLNVAQASLVPPNPSLTGRAAALVTGDWAIRDVILQNSEDGAQDFAKAALGKDVLLYIHGYRETFETAAISAAQLSDGISFKGATALFAWPSGGATLDYSYDRESAMWSRDALEEVLLALTQSPTGGKVHIVAHSLGTLITLETLRSIKAQKGETVMARIGAIVLASPDIDIDLFTRHVERLGPESQKITVITASNDRALEVSRRIAGGVMRAGAADQDKLSALGVRVADATAFAGGIINHDLFLRSDDVRGVVQRAIERER
jgi:esterase/lipase superfamily enzyme